MDGADMVRVSAQHRLQDLNERRNHGLGYGAAARLPVISGERSISDSSASTSTLSGNFAAALAIAFEYASSSAGRSALGSVP